MIKAGHGVTRILGAGALGATLLFVGCAAPSPSGSATGAGSAGTVASEGSAASVRRVGFLTDYSIEPHESNGAITLQDGAVEQSNFYPVLRINEMPAIDVPIVPSTDNPTGVGEPVFP